jgi:signal transduction histidine kinase
MKGHRRARPIGLRIFTLVALGMTAPMMLIGWAGLSVHEELSRRARQHDRLVVTAAAERVSSALSQGLEVVNALATEESWTAEPSSLARLRSAVLRTYLHHHLLFDGYFALNPAGELVAGNDLVARVDGAALVSEARRLARPGFIAVPRGQGADLVALMPVGGTPGAPSLVVGARVSQGSARLKRLLGVAAGSVLELRDLKGRRLAGAGDGPAPAASDEAMLRALTQASSPQAGVCANCGGGDGAAWAMAPVGAAHWAVLAWQPLARADAFGRQLERKVGLASLALLVLAALFAWGATVSVTRPLRVLEEAARRITEGALDARIVSQPGDEVGELGEALETMRIAVADSQARVVRLNAELEGRVAQRTQELVGLNEALSHREVERTQLVRKLLSAQEDERKRIARELHDEMAQQLAALSIGLDAAAQTAPETTRDALDKLREVAATSLSEVHRLILDLRPSVLDDLGLQSALEWCADRTLRANGISVRCEFSGLEAPLPWELETAIFRVAQEALTNVARHSKADTVLLQVQAQNGQLALEIEDDGDGFDPAEVPPPHDNGRGLGLLGMKERMEVLGGTLVIDSAPGQGTHLRFEVPLPREPRDG